VPHRADDDEGRRAGGVDEGLARVAAADRGRHREAGVHGVGSGRGVGQEAVGVRRDDRLVGQRTETEHRQVGRERVEQVQGQAARARHLRGPRHRSHGEGGPVHSDDDPGLTHSAHLRSRVPCDGGCGSSTSA
jgi:hypothetical protein